MGISDIDYRLEKERIEGGIRELKLEGYRADREKEQFVTQRKWVEVDIAREDLTQAKTRLEIAREKTTQFGSKLQHARVETNIIEVELSMVRDRLSASTRERDLQFQMLTENMRGLDLRLSEKREDNDNLRQELAVRGFSSMPGSFSLREILGS